MKSFFSLAAVLLCGLTAQAQEVITNATRATLKVRAVKAVVDQGALTLTVAPAPSRDVQVREVWSSPAEEGMAHGPDPYTLFTGTYGENATFNHLVFTLPPGGSMTFSAARDEGAVGGHFEFHLVLLGEPSSPGGTPGSIGEMLSFHARAGEGGSMDEVILHQVEDDGPGALPTLSPRYVLEPPSAGKPGYRLRTFEAKDACCVIL